MWTELWDDFAVSLAGAKTFDYDKRAADGDAGRTETADIQRDGGGRVTLRIFESLKPVIGAINGAAVGIGVTMQLPMDIRIASDKARFGFVFNKRGINPEAASSWFLPRLVGIQQALEWCYTGRVFPASEAHSGGLVSKVVPAAELMDTALALAESFGANGTPGFFIGIIDKTTNTVKITRAISGAVPFAQFAQALEGALAQAKK